MRDTQFRQGIEDWLAQISPTFALRAEKTQPNKKRKLDQSSVYLPSPTSSMSDHPTEAHYGSDPVSAASFGSQSTPLKRKIAPRAVDKDKTPKARKLPSIIDNAPSLSSQSDSQASGRSSPVRQFPIMGRDGYFIDCQTLNPNQTEIPAELTELLLDVQDISSGFGIIPHFLKVFTFFFFFLQRSRNLSGLGVSTLKVGNYAANTKCSLRLTSTSKPT